MNKLFFKILVLSMFVFAFFFIVLLKNSVRDDVSFLIGDYLFSNTDDVSRVIVINSDNEMTFSKVSGIWSNEDGYHIDNKLMDEFLSDLKNATYGSISGNLELSTKIILVSDDDEALFEFGYFYDEIEDKNYVEVKNKVYEMSDQFYIPYIPEDWFIQPLLPFDDVEIESVYGLDTHFHFDELTFYQAVKKQAINPDLPKKFRIILQNGLDLDFSIYEAKEDYWLEVKMSKTILPTKEATNYLKYNSSLYDGWIFKISNQSGAELYKHSN